MTIIKKDKKWSKDEETFIKDNIDKLSNNEIANTLNRSLNSISSFISRKQIKKELKLEPDEKIKPIFNERYFITNHGRIFDKMHNEMKPYNFSGYLRITLSPDEKIKKKYFIHRLVAEAFIKNDNKDKKLYVNHIDLNRSNNNASNLEWCSQSENEMHKMKNKPEIKEHLSLINSKSDNIEKEKVYKEVNNIRILITKRKTNSEISKELNVDIKRVSAIRNKRLWKNISDKYFKLF